MTGGSRHVTGFLDAFRGLDDSTKNILADLKSPLQLGFAALALASERTGKEYLSIEHIVAALEAAGVAVKHVRLRKAMARAGDRVSRKVIDDEIHYKLMTRGRREAEQTLQVGNVNMLYMDGSTPRTDRRNLGEILSHLSGTIRVCDPYYGLRTLETLELIPAGCTVRFLTGRTSEKTVRLSGPLRDFRRERPNTELRLCPNAASMHDRYIVSADRIYLVGHGLKDIGSRESFIIVIHRTLAADLTTQVEQSFDDKWDGSAPL